MPKYLFVVTALLTVLLACSSARTVPQEQPRQPTATNEQGLPPEEAAYFAAVVKQTDALNGAIRELVVLVDNADTTNEDWRLDIAVQVASIRTTYLQLKAVEPPENVRFIHELLLDGAGDCDSMTDLLTEGIDSRDGSKITAASSLLESCVAKMTEAYRAIEKYAGGRE